MARNPTPRFIVVNMGFFELVFFFFSNYTGPKRRGFVSKMGHAQFCMNRPSRSILKNSFLFFRWIFVDWSVSPQRGTTIKRMTRNHSLLLSAESPEGAWPEFEPGKAGALTT